MQVIGYPLFDCSNLKAVLSKIDQVRWEAKKDGFITAGMILSGILTILPSSGAGLAYWTATTVARLSVAQLLTTAGVFAASTLGFGGAKVLNDANSEAEEVKEQVEEEKVD